MRQSRKTATVVSLPNSGFKVPAKSTRDGRIPRLLIAWHSPYAFLKTGLCMCPPEKSQDSAPFGVRQSILCSPVCEDNIAKTEHVLRISG